MKDKFEPPIIPKCNDLYLLLGAVKAKEYSCPNCDTTYDYDSEFYVVNNETYPKIFNETKGYTLDGDFWNWDEVHCCQDCETKYWFNNGAY